MTIDIFSWRPNNDTTGAIKFRVLRAQFGDAYKQTAPDGLHTKSQSWPLRFIGDQSVMLDIQSFLDRHAGAKSFYWTPPLGQTILVKAPAYSIQPHGGAVYTLSVTFEEDFQI